MALLLAGILALGAYLRFTGLNWDGGVWIHPDESHMQTTLAAIHTPDSLLTYFDTATSPLNVHNNEGRQYSYGTLPLFVTRVAAEWLDQACADPPDPLSHAAAVLLTGEPDLVCGPDTFTNYRAKEIGRAFSALADLGTVLLVFLIGRRLHGEVAGLLAAALAVLTAFSIQQAHFFTVDSMACFFTVLTALFALRAAQCGGWLNFGLAGLATGMAAACKISAAPAALLVVLAAVAWLWSQAPQRRKLLLRDVFLQLVFAGVLCLLAFRVFQPYAFEGPGFFGLKLSQEWLERVGQIRDEQAGVADYPSGRQWTNRAPVLFPLKDMVFWGMGLPLGIAAWAAWAFVGYELWRGRRVHLVLWAWTGVTFLYHATRWVKTMRTFLPLYPFLVVMAAYGLIRLCQASARRWRITGHGLAALILTGAAIWAYAVFSIYLRPHTRLAASRWIYANIAPGAVLANEHWDWGPPLPVDGYSPGIYDGFEMQHYNDDTWDKRAQLYDWLDRADYVIIGSNRLYASIARLPARYPLTTAYYRALFAGELGFELVADFTSYPAIGPFQFPDDETPYALMDVQGYTYQTQPIRLFLPPADEAFSVYDHPRTLVFRKTEGYSRQLVEQALGGIDVDQALQGLSPRAATAAPTVLEFDAQTWADQQSGGTWLDMFDRESLLNRYPGLAALVWWIVLTVLGWLAFPLLFVALPRLRDRGYGLARVLGLLVVAYLTWLVASLHVLPNTRWTILRMGMFLALVGGGVGWSRRREILGFVRRRWRLILLMEGLFALLYLAWLGVRLVQPDLWHPYVGGEKPMDFAYLNAVIKSTWFPPYNPWFAGSMINYYYFGFVIVGTLIKLIGTVPAIAYNLAVPMLFALVGVGAFSVAYNLFGGSRRGALLAGLMGLAFAVLLGNLGVVQVIGGGLITLDAETGGDLFPSTIPGFPETVSLLRGLGKLIFTDAAFPVWKGASAWYWSPTRIIPIGPGEAVVPITEFPAFTFLYGDLHAHMVSLVVMLLSLALMVNWVRSPRPGWLSLLIGALSIGALYPTNTWDYPTFLVLGLAALAVGVCSRPDQLLLRRLVPFAWRAFGLVGLTLLLYLPYLQNYAAGYTSLKLWEGSRTPVGVFFWIHAIMLFPLLTRLLIEVWRAVTRWRSSAGAARGVAGPAFTCVLLGALAASLAFLLECGLALAAVIKVGVPVTQEAVLGAWRGIPVAYVTLPIGVLVAVLALARGLPASRRLLWLMVGLAMGLCLIVEVVVLEGDIERMNTVFKFYLQVWMLLAIAAGVSLAWAWEHARRWPFEVRILWGLGMLLLVVGGALFLPFGIRARAVDRISSDTGLTLDGMAFMVQARIHDGPPESGGREIMLASDHAAIEWMQDRIQGSPVILEGLGYREYLWGNRVSVYTGLPAVVGWRWHQIQQRTVLPGVTVDWRYGDVRECYNTRDIARAWEILQRYDAHYIYVGEYERAYYDPVGLVKFDEMVALGLLQIAYDEEGVTIYELVDP